jgi:hypothetical protein
MVEALQEDNGWLEYNLLGIEDAHTDQRKRPMRPRR